MAADQSFSPWRALRPTEKVIAFAEIQGFLDAQPQAFENGAKPLVIEMLVRALPHVRQAAGAPDAVRALQLDTSKLRAFVAEWLKGVASEGYRQVEHEYKVDRQDTTVIRFASEEEKEPEQTTFDFIDDQATSLSRRIADRTEQALEREAIDVERTGGEPDEVVSEVMGDVLDAKVLQAEARSVLTKAFNVGRQQFADERGDEIESAELSALLDKNTCDYCFDHDGDEYEFGTPEEEEMTPPLRDCEGGDLCRCIKVFNFKSPDDTEPPADEEPADDGENGGA